MMNGANDITSVTDFLNRIYKEEKIAEKNRRKSDFLFRGQPVDEPLLPRIGRKDVTPKKRLKMEQLIIIEFKRACPLLIAGEPKDDWGWLSVAQYYGLNTRLLDWTCNALVSLWFAVKDVPNKKDNNGVVWIFKPDLEDYQIGAHVAKKEDDHIKLTTKNGGNPKNISPFKIKLTRIYRPPIIDKRILVQSSVFTAHGINSDGEMKEFEIDELYEKKLLKLTIMRNYHPLMRKQLHILHYILI
jgi:hypothetical protein